MKEDMKDEYVEHGGAWRRVKKMDGWEVQMDSQQETEKLVRFPQRSDELLEW